MKLRSVLTSALAAGVMMTATSVSAANLKVLASWNKNIWPTYVVLDTFVKNVAKVGGDKVNLRISGPEVVPPFEQLQPVKSGVFDILFTHGVYHVGSKGLAAIADAMTADPVGKRSSGVWDSLDKFYQKTHSLKLLAISPSSTAGYHIFLKDPIKGGSWDGRKIRGTQTYHGVIKLFGGEPVVMPGSQVYSALEKGVVDGAAWPAAGMLSMKHFEVAKYKVRPTFGTSTLPILMNMNSWKKLNAEEKGILLQAGEMTELQMPWIGDELQAQEDAKLAKLGVKITQIPADKVAAMKKAFSDSLWALGEKCCGDDAKKMRDLAKKAGISP
ncbi:MAG: TRAP transporter substrate-binding protein DctP [Pseudomonadota bacterium]|nr:C4-dicarboxylate ABC transporter substrate-binding protein [Alphaproteobacteria bacterium]MEC7944428.1 TRAP transporter substrate-binding protein DctP [Pseudomonadota bacterium]MEC8288299.1 TRAP transporter substrate-binding protein DctP [Pseudomonadota bacterium]MEC8463947.1 TRAP transporter substrate-binding protein DctP [Pseudomonadota bacterium]MEC8724867.1 TRAP transporter substrate-binding protein DctP [Pseudomonadota bacterium]